MSLFGFKKTEDKSKTIYNLLKSKIDDTKVHTEILSKITESSTFNPKLEEYNKEFLEFMSNLQTFQNFFVNNKQINKIRILNEFITSRERIDFLIKLDNKTKSKLEKRIKELTILKESIFLANKSDLNSKNK